ncbi:MAG: LysE family transporter [Bacteroidaceae bacterium]|nr:LysE family transporter [Bacteroidaceae bacterium]MBO7347526.1 LysE family transporter [Bacteroidaceae bacterium]
MLTIIQFIVKGLIIGIIASAPMGPVGVLTVQRTLNKGRWYGFVTGIGAAISDILYAAISLVGISLVMDFVEKPRNMFWLKLIGSVMLFIFGLYTFLSHPGKVKHVQGKRGSLMHNGFTGFLVTLSNPLIIFLFIALMARFDFVISRNYFAQGIGYMAIFGGAMIWWFSLTAIIDKVRNRFQDNTVWKINRTIGVIVMIAALIGCILALLPKFGIIL